MPKYTENYALIKPLQTESYDVDVFNKNMEILDDVISKLALKLHPVGSFYTTSDGTNPSEIFGGTWEQIKGKFLLGASENYANGTVGGEATHKLSIAEMPSHKHTTTFNRDACEGTSGNAVYGDELREGKDTITSDSCGGDQAHNNMPPYLACYIWKRTA